jgi:hypothetical protein
VRHAGAPCYAPQRHRWQTLLDQDRSGRVDQGSSQRGGHEESIWCLVAAVNYSVDTVYSTSKIRFAMVT